MLGFLPELNILDRTGADSYGLVVFPYKQQLQQQEIEVIEKMMCLLTNISVHDKWKCILRR